MTRNSLNIASNVGVVESGFTRTSGESASGLGKVGMVRFIVSDDIDGFRPGEEIAETTVGGGTSTVMNSAGQMTGMTIGNATITIDLSNKEDKDEFATVNEDLLKVFPNPTKSVINVHLNGRNDFEKVVINNLTGQEVYNSGNILTNHKRINVHNLSNGLYFMNVYTKGGVITRKFEVVK